MAIHPRIPICQLCNATLPVSQTAFCLRCYWQRLNGQHRQELCTLQARGMPLASKVAAIVERVRTADAKTFARRQRLLTALSGPAPTTASVNQPPQP